MRGKLVDATLLIHLGRDARNKRLGPTSQWWSRQQGPFILSPVTVAEVLEGYPDQRDAIRWMRTVGDILQITDQTAAIAASIQRRRKKRLGENDAWMAASAIEHGLVLLTRDNAFASTPGLRWSTYPT